MGWEEDEQVTKAGIRIVTVNIGAASKIMEEDGHAKPIFTDFLRDIKEGQKHVILFAKEFRGTRDTTEEHRWGELGPGENSINHKHARFKRFKHSVHAVSRMRVARLSAGVILLQKELPYRPEYVETGEDAFTLILQEARDQRTAIHGAYFPSEGKVRSVDGCSLVSRFFWRPKAQGGRCHRTHSSACGCQGASSGNRGPQSRVT